MCTQLLNISFYKQHTMNLLRAMIPIYFKDKFVPIISYSNTSPKILKNRRVLHELFLPRYDSYILPMVKSLREVWSLDNENLLMFLLKIQNIASQSTNWKSNFKILIDKTRNRGGWYFFQNELKLSSHQFKFESDLIWFLNATFSNISADQK